VSAQKQCASCNAVLYGPYCFRCGEQEVSEHELTVRHFVAHNFLHEMTHLDGKIFRTLKCLLFRPGFLSEEYFAGRRQPYINPVRLLLIAAVAFALLVSATSRADLTIMKVRLSMLPPGLPPTGGSIEATAAKLDWFGMLSREIAHARKSKNLDSPEAVEKFHHELKTYATVLEFANVLLFGGLLFLLFHRRRRYFVEHLVFSLHFAAFVLLFSIVSMSAFRLEVFLFGGGSVRPLRVAISVIAFSITVVQLVYLQKGLMRFYHHNPAQPPRWWSRQAWVTRLAVVVLLLANSVFMTVIYLAGAAIALLRV
jgi:hypothetical protein